MLIGMFLSQTSDNLLKLCYFHFIWTWKKRTQLAI